MPTQQDKSSDQAEWQSMDRDTFLSTFSDFESARENAAEAAQLEQNRSHARRHTAPAEVPFPEIKAASDELGIERKIPRQMHIWFAAGLGLLACVAALAQGFFSPPPALSTKHEESATAPSNDSEPPLTKLQQELAHQRNDEDTTLSPETPRAVSGKWSKQHAAQRAAPPIAPADLMADLPGQLPPGSETSSDLMRRYENDKARALITGSKMLAVNHSAGNVLGLSDLTTANLPSQLSNLIQATPKALAQIVHPKLAASPQALPVSTSLPALSPRAHAPGALVLEGTAIPCVLLTELRSDLPGMIVAQVSEDIFDSLHAQAKVIPRGARLIGRYDNRITSGQQRLVASFHRLILPNGTSVELEKMEGAYADGSAGLKGDVDTHFWARFGQAFLTAGLARAVQPSASANPGNSYAASVLGPNAAGQILIDTARLDLQANGLLQPTLLIHQGDPFVVMVNRDLALPILSSD